MPLFIFSTNKPAANNDPSVDQPDMLQNNVSTNAIIDVDHFTFNDNQGGLHKQTQIVDQLAIPPGLLAGQSTIYSKNVQVDVGGVNNSCLFVTPGISNNEYQLTRPIDLKFASFGKFINYTGPVDQLGGWTFLPGGLLFQYGSRLAGNATVIDFPISFSSFTNISITITRTGVSDSSSSVQAINLTNFTYHTNSGGTSKIYWQAVGP